MNAEQKQNAIEARNVEAAGTTGLAKFTDAQLAAFKAIRIEPGERDEFVEKAVASALRAKISSKITTCVKMIYDEKRKNNAGNVARLEATLKEFENIFNQL